MSKELEALERIKKSHLTAMACLGIEDKETEQAIDIIETELKRLKELEDNFNNLNEFYFNLWYLTEALKSKKYAKNLAIEFVDNKFCLINSKTGTIYEIVDDVKGLKVGYKAHQKQEKSLKALEIIKKKRVNVEEFIEMFEDWKEITYEKWIIYYEENGYYIQGNEDFDYNRLTKEEFDFLKEVLL